jgi:hypothetical protein
MTSQQTVSEGLSTLSTPDFFWNPVEHVCAPQVGTTLQQFAVLGLVIELGLAFSSYPYSQPKSVQVFNSQHTPSSGLVVVATPLFGECPVGHE